MKNTSAFIVALDHSMMTARVIKQWNRPDGKLSTFRGNMQILPDSNVFVGWGDTTNYMSEHAFDGDLLVEASFLSDRISTYRAYKYHDFVGIPEYPPSLKASVYSTPPPFNTTITMLHVSWNGATEVASWNFYGFTPDNDVEEPSQPFLCLGQAAKSGFETAYAWSGSATYVFAEAVAADGRGIRNSTVQMATTMPFDKQNLSLGRGKPRPQQCLYDLVGGHKCDGGMNAVRPHDIDVMDPSRERVKLLIQSLSLVFVGFSLSFLLRLVRAQIWHRWNRLIHMLKQQHELA